MNNEVGRYCMISKCFEIGCFFCVEWKSWCK